jgi:hypothetical protein
MEKLKKVKDVQVIEEYMAIMELLEKLGYETETLKMDRASQIKHDILKVLKDNSDQLF